MSVDADGQASVSGLPSGFEVAARAHRLDGSVGKDCSHRGRARNHHWPCRPQGSLACTGAGARGGDPVLPRRLRGQDRRPPRPQPRGRRADDRPAPGVRVPARRDRVRHRPPVLRAQAADRQAGLQRPAQPGRALRLPQPRRVRARRRRELPRVDVPVLGRRHREGAPPARRAHPAYGRGHRRRSPHGWHGLGGDQQHRRRQGPALVIVVNDNTRSYAPTIGGLADHLATLRTTAGTSASRLGQAHAEPHARRRRRHVRDPARHEEGHQGHRRPAGDVRGPGPEVPRSGDGHDEAAVEAALRRARSYGGPVLVHVITEKGRGYDHARNDEGDQFHAVGVINPRRACRWRSPGARGPTTSATRWWLSAANARTSSGSPRRC